MTEITKSKFCLHKERKEPNKYPSNKRGKSSKKLKMSSSKFLRRKKSITQNMCANSVVVLIKNSRMRTTETCTCSMPVPCSWYARNASRQSRLVHTRVIRLESAKTANITRGVQDARKRCIRSNTRPMWKGNSAFQPNRWQWRTVAHCATWTSSRGKMVGDNTWQRRAVKITRGNEKW